jgi:predicted O-methyltransferase YrrM
LNGRLCGKAICAKRSSRSTAQWDFMLVDIWAAMARPALKLVTPHLRPGGIVVCDNTQQHRAEYADYFAFLEDPANGFRTMTLPFDGGLELSVRCQP